MEAATVMEPSVLTVEAAEALASLECLPDFPVRAPPRQASLRHLPATRQPLQASAARGSAPHLPPLEQRAPSTHQPHRVCRLRRQATILRRRRATRLLRLGTRQPRHPSLPHPQHTALHRRRILALPHRSIAPRRRASVPHRRSTARRARSSIQAASDARPLHRRRRNSARRVRHTLPPARPITHNTLQRRRGTHLPPRARRLPLTSIRRLARLAQRTRLRKFPLVIVVPSPLVFADTNQTSRSPKQN
jgi:hypothetical protein